MGNTPINPTWKKLTSDNPSPLHGCIKSAMKGGGVLKLSLPPQTKTIKIN